ETVERARANDQVLRFVGVIDPGEGTRVSLRSYDSDHPFARIRLTDNIVKFNTDRYSDNPLVVQGPGAGPEVTAGGVFADLLRLANYLGATL
ncbi:MAG TPA: bifunctional aspartate kinase/homoserine dehydrogenase I, partial [Acidimicrobiia bacterium]|nr:bifunctional aspartate kinase/homoserine dehydrogenase I [Acidimicrobiia bacterium]